MQNTPEHAGPAPAEAHVFVRRGDAAADVEALLAEVRARGSTPEAEGFIRYFFVTRAEQTVVMVRDRGAPFAAALRARRGWREPADEPGAGRN